MSPVRSPSLSIFYSGVIIDYVAVRSPSLSTFYSGVISLLDLSNPLHICMRALFLVAFFSFLRISNLVSYTLADVRDPKGCYLRMSSVTFTAQEILLRVTRTKTIQLRQRVLDIPFSNSLIIHQLTNQSGYANLVRCVWFETPMKHWTEAFPR